MKENQLQVSGYRVFVTKDKMQNGIYYTMMNFMVYAIYQLLVR